MTPEDTIREKSALLADWADEAHPVTVDDVRADLIGALDVLVAERDRLAARLAAAERERDEALHAEDVAERYREAAETRLADMRRQRDDLDESRRLALVAEQDQRARNAALTAALNEAGAMLDMGYDYDSLLLNDLYRWWGRTKALAAADRPEGTTPPEPVRHTDLSDAFWDGRSTRTGRTPQEGNA